MGDEERKVVGEIVASGLSVAGWCAATGRMGTTKAYRILNWFRENVATRAPTTSSACSSARWA